MKETEKVYLGDGVYAEYLGDSVAISTSDGIRTTNVIWLEPEVLQALIKYVKDSQ